jgi:hypothetical protein
MSTMQTRWILATSLLAAIAGCDVTVHDCKKEPEAEICQDDEDDDEDAGEEPIDEEDASVDAGKRDAGADAGKDGGTSADAGKDGGSSGDGSTTPDSSSTAPITVDDFCAAQLKTAVAWRDALDGLCDGLTKDKQTRDDFLQRSLAYAADDAEGKCITARNASITAGNTTFDGSKAMACADAFAGNFMAPPDPFPTTGGIDLAMYEAKIAHGAPALVQIPACRAAFKGKLARDKPCTDNFECVDGLRCLSAPGNTTTCQPALTGGTCAQSANCADGYTCVGSTAGGGKTCVKSDALPLTGGNCSFSIECATDYVCNASNKCANPVASVICK